MNILNFILKIRKFLFIIFNGSIEVNIKLASNNQIYNLPIRKSETIFKLKEFCNILSNIPQDQQTLLFNEKILLDEKLISDYRIENNHTIILVKKEVPKSKNAPLNQNSNISNSNEKIFNNDNKNFLNNKGLNPNAISNAFIQAPDFISLYCNLDFKLIDDLYESLGIGRISEIIGVDPQKIKELQEMLNFLKTLIELIYKY